MRFPVSVKGVVEIDGRVPLLRNERSEWELPGGRLEAGEALEATVEREVLEELSLSVECRSLVDAWTYRAAGTSTTVVIVVYDCAILTAAAASRSLRWSSEHTDAVQAIDRERHSVATLRPGRVGTCPTDSSRY